MFIKGEKKTMQTFLSCPRNEEEALGLGGTNIKPIL
jgi:hypothetical protein